MSSHTEFDNGCLPKIKAVASRKPGEPHPFELRKDAVAYYFKVSVECAQAALLKFGGSAGLEGLFVSAGVKLDQRGGVKIDHRRAWGGLLGWGSAGVAGAEACAPACRGAFRPERKWPLPIAATCGAGLWADL